MRDCPRGNQAGTDDAGVAEADVLSNASGLAAMFGQVPGTANGSADHALPLARSNFAVAAGGTMLRIRFRLLKRIEGINCLETTFLRDPSFSLQKFAERSFGVFQEEPQDIVWKFSPAVAEAVAEYAFHPNQTIRRQKDGSVLVSFRAGGLMEMCWHLYTWGANVEVVAPLALRDLMKSALSHRNFQVGET